MNWTGGNLQRHSKANANALVKKQRQNFAKARLQPPSRRPCPPSPTLSIHKAPQHKFPPKAEQASGKTSARHHLAHGFNFGTEETRSIDGQRSGTNVLRSLDRQVPGQASDDEWHGRQSGSANGLESARKALLDKADWVGLATVRPLKIDRRARDDMKGLGRRRKIAQLKKSRPMSQQNSGQRILGSTRPAFEVPSLRTEGISLRIGSNIHQTQTTPSIVVRKEPIHTAERAMDELVPPEIHWGKKATGNTGDEARRKGSSDKHQARPCGPSRGATAPLDSAGEHNLIGLNEAVALGLTSWDKVRGLALSGIQRSVSISSASSRGTSPKPLGTEVEIHRKHASCEQDEALAISDGSYGHIWPQASTPVLPDIIHRVIAVGILKDGSGQKFSPSSFLEPALYPDHPLAPSHSLAEESIPVASDVTYKYDVALEGQVAPRPQFTLDDQVKLEQTVKELERESQQRESSSAADKMGHSGTIDSLWFPNNIGTSDVDFANDSDLSGFASMFSSNENEFHGHHRPVSRVTGVYTKCSTEEQQSRPEDVPNLVTSKTGCFLTSDGVEKAPPRLTDRRPSVPLALRERDQVDQTIASQRPVTSNPRQNIDMDDEAWMRYVFPGNFDQTQDVFHFQGGAVPPKFVYDWPEANLPINKPSCSRHGISGAWVGRERSGSAPRIIYSPNSIPTAVNTSIIIPSLPNRDYSETDFLSQLSPMEGRFDERLRDISLYNNAPETDLDTDISSTSSLQIFRDGASRNLPGSLVPAKRKALDPVRERASSGWPRSTDRSNSKSLPLSHGQPSAWPFSDSGDSANTIQDSIKPTSKRRSAAARPHQSTAFQKPVDKFGQTETLVQGSLKNSEQAWTAAHSGGPRAGVTS